MCIAEVSLPRLGVVPEVGAKVGDNVNRKVADGVTGGARWREAPPSQATGGVAVWRATVAREERGG